MNFYSSFAGILLAVAPLAAQSTQPVIYAESFRRAATHIMEDHFEIQLTPRDPVFRDRVKDSNGADRYLLTITPHGPEGDTEVTSWLVRLVDLQHKMYDNILLTSNAPSGESSLNSQGSDSNSDPKNDLWRLDPSTFAPVPVRAQRIIKVDGFYVFLRVKAFHFTPPDSPYLDSMSVFVEFTNADPRAGGGQNK